MVACGNTVIVYSLTTAMIVGTLRSKRQQGGEQQVAKIKGDVHKANIVAMHLIEGKVKIGEDFIC